MTNQPWGMLQTGLIVVSVTLMMRYLQSVSRRTPKTEGGPDRFSVTHPKIFRWIGILCMAFFGFCFVMALQAHFKRPDQRWAFAWFIPFIALGYYLYLESFSRIESDGIRLRKVSRLFAEKIYLWDDVRTYTFNERMHSHSFRFVDGKKLDVSDYMLGITRLLRYFAKRRESWIIEQLEEGAWKDHKLHLLQLLAWAGKVEHQTFFARVYSEGEKRRSVSIKNKTVAALAIHVKNSQTFDTFCRLRFPPGVNEAMDRILKTSGRAKTVSLS